MQNKRRARNCSFFFVEKVLDKLDKQKQTFYNCIGDKYAKTNITCRCK